MIDLTLDRLKRPAITGLVPSFGTTVEVTEKNKGGLSTTEVDANMALAYELQREVNVSTSDTTSIVEHDAKVALIGDETITLTLQGASYGGCELKITNRGSQTNRIEFNDNDALSVGPTQSYTLEWTGRNWWLGKENEDILKITFTVEGNLNQSGTRCLADVDLDTIKEYARSGIPIHVIVRNITPEAGIHTMSLCNVTAITQDGSDGEYTHLVISGTSDIYGITRYIRITIDGSASAKIYSSQRKNSFSTTATSGTLLQMRYPNRLSTGERIILECANGWSDEEKKYIWCEGAKYSIEYSDVKVDNPFTIELEVIDTVCYITAVLSGSIPRKEITSAVVTYAGSASETSNNITEVNVGTARIRRGWDGYADVNIEIPSYKSTTTYNYYKNVITLKEGKFKLKRGVIIATQIVNATTPLTTYFDIISCEFFPGSRDLGNALLVKNVSSGAVLQIYME